MTDTADPAEVAAGLRAALAAIEAGEVETTDVQRAYLAGALDVLDALAGRGSRPLSVHDTSV